MGASVETTLGNRWQTIIATTGPACESPESHAQNGIRHRRKRHRGGVTVHTADAEPGSARLLGCFRARGRAALAK